MPGFIGLPEILLLGLVVLLVFGPSDSPRWAGRWVAGCGSSKIRSPATSTLPVFILALVRFRVLSAAKLRRNRRIGIVAMAGLAVALPGVDPVTTAMEMIPLFLLYEGSIWLSVFFERRWVTASPTPRASSASA